MDSHTHVAAEYAETLGGYPHVYAASYHHQRLIQLEFQIETSGRELTYDIATALFAMANVPGKVMLFRHFDFSCNTLFYHGNSRYEESKAIILTPFFGYLPPNHTSDFFTGKITLISYAI